jgi:DMSO/TMAO reductase YedYZ molybdopterin-dependent catalytic subunit
MRHAWVNVALLALVVVEALSGFGGMTGGRLDQAWRLWLHGVGGCAILALLGWKAAVILGAWRRPRRRAVAPARVAFGILLALFLGTLATGFAWTAVGRVVWLGYSLMTVHLALALASLPLFLAHAWRMRYVFRVPDAAGRRAFLRLGLALAGGVALRQGTAVGAQAAALPGAGRRFTGSYQVGSADGRFPTVSWLFDAPDPIDVASWRLGVAGAVARPFTLTYAELVQSATDTQIATIDCTGGWWSRQEWRGVRLARLLDRAEVSPGARSVVVESVSGYSRRFDLREARAFLLAIAVGGRPLPHGHGFPARLVAPSHRGYDWVKWIAGLRVEATPPWEQPPLPLR